MRFEFSHHFFNSFLYYFFKKANKIFANSVFYSIDFTKTNRCIDMSNFCKTAGEKYVRFY